MAGRKMGSKNKVQLPTSYDVGDGAVNFFWAILSKAKDDDAQMWQDFQGTELYEAGTSGGIDVMGIAWWVSNYIGG